MSSSKNQVQEKKTFIDDNVKHNLDKLRYEKLPKQIQVIKRSGQFAPLDISKIRKVVDWACYPKEVNSIALESGLKTRLRHGITTREIQDNLINCALELCDSGATRLALCSWAFIYLEFVERNFS